MVRIVKARKEGATQTAAVSVTPLPCARVIRLNHILCGAANGRTCLSMSGGVCVPRACGLGAIAGTTSFFCNEIGGVREASRPAGRPPTSMRDIDRADGRALQSLCPSIRRS
ncbi:MAG: hypothetical protein ACREO8_05715 [Luteimonas sp.]